MNFFYICLKVSLQSCQFGFIDDFPVSFQTEYAFSVISSLFPSYGMFGLNVFYILIDFPAKVCVPVYQEGDLSWICLYLFIFIADEAGPCSVFILHFFPPPIVLLLVLVRGA